jgi:hypothetical protein
MRGWLEFMFGLEIYLKEWPRAHTPAVVLNTTGYHWLSQFSNLAFSFTILPLTDWAVEKYFHSLIL